LVSSDALQRQKYEGNVGLKCEQTDITIPRNVEKNQLVS
jgi:hypothetical protein